MSDRNPPTSTDGESKVTITCDRCERKVEGLRTPDATAGFYDVSGGSWARFALPGEANVCDTCMWSDPRYWAERGHFPALTPLEELIPETSPVIYWLAVQRYPGHPFVVNAHDGTRHAGFLGAGRSDDLMEAVTHAVVAANGKLYRWAEVLEKEQRSAND